MGVLPARAGMILSSRPIAAPPTGAPRASGDDPKLVEQNERLFECSPRERG